MDKNRFVKGLKLSLREAVAFGPQFELRHLGKILGWQTMAVRAYSIGRINIRPRNSDSATFGQIFIDKIYDVFDLPQKGRILSSYSHIISSGATPVIIDAGANVGASTLWFAKKFPEASIISIEPDPETFKICCSNTSHLSNVKTVAAALGSGSGSVDIKGTEWSCATQTVRSDTGDTPIITIPEALELAGPDAKLFIAKIDIEGFERDVFAENTEWVAQAPVVMIEPHDWLFPGEHTFRAALRAFASTNHELLIRGDTLIFIL